MEKTLELTAVISAAEMVVKQGQEITVISEADLVGAVGVLGEIATAKKRVEELRTFFVGPLNTHVKAINDRFKAISLPLDMADGMVRGKVSEWKRAEAARIAEQERLNREAAEAIMKLPVEGPGVATNEEIQAIIAPEVPIQRVHTDGGSAQFKKVWKFKVVDPGIVPVFFKVVDETLIRQDIARQVKAAEQAKAKMEPSINGVEIWQEDQLAVSGN
jgi:hypothetical protein